MPAHHTIHTSTKLITTIWSGEAVDSELIDALLKYQRDIKSKPDYYSYNEIVDFTKATDFNLSTAGIRRLAHLAANTDVQGIKTKLAIIVNIPLAFGLGRMYEVYRGLVPSVFKKDVRVFKNYNDALAWIENDED